MSKRRVSRKFGHQRANGVSASASSGEAVARRAGERTAASAAMPSRSDRDSRRIGQRRAARPRCPVSSIVSRIAATRAASVPSSSAASMVVGVDPAARENQGAGGERHLAGPLGDQQFGRPAGALAHQHEGRGGNGFGKIGHPVLRKFPGGIASRPTRRYLRRPERRGAVAQMGERCNRTAEVRGSIPLSSTSLGFAVSPPRSHVRGHGDPEFSSLRRSRATGRPERRNAAPASLVLPACFPMEESDMAYDERDGGRRRGRGRWRDDERGDDGWGRETQWRGDQSFGGGWGNQTARPQRPGDRTIRPRATALAGRLWLESDLRAARASTPASAARASTAPTSAAPARMASIRLVGLRSRHGGGFGSSAREYMIARHDPHYSRNGAAGRSPSSTATMTNIGARTSRASTASSAPGARERGEQSAGDRPGPRAYGGDRLGRQPCRHGRSRSAATGSS